MAEYNEYTLSSVCSRLSSGKGIPSSQVFNNGRFPVFGGNGLRGYTNQSNFDGECAIIGRQGVFCGNVRYFSGEAYMTEHAVVVCANAQHNTRYLSYLLSTMNLGRLSGQSAQPGLSVKTLSTQTVRLPLKAVQDKVVSVLATLDDKIAINNRINDNLEQQAASLLEKYCNSETEVARLDQVMSFENGFAFQSKTYLPYGKYRIITIKNVQDGKIDSQGAAYINDIPIRMKNGCYLHEGDVLLSLTGNVGRVGIVCESGLLLNQRVAKIIPRNSQILPWLYYYFRLPSTKTMLESIAKGTAQQNLSPVETLQLTVPFHNESAMKLSQSIMPMFKQEITNNMESLILADLRDSLIPRLMSGEIDVSSLSF